MHSLIDKNKDLNKQETIPSDKLQMLEEFENRRRVRAITVSTNDAEVKSFSPV